MTIVFYPESRDSREDDESVNDTIESALHGASAVCVLIDGEEFPVTSELRAVLESAAAYLARGKAVEVRPLARQRFV